MTIDLRVLRVLDRHTVLIGGPGLEDVFVGQDLLIVGVGPFLEEVGARVVVPKARIEVDAVADKYAIAKSPAIVVEQAIPSGIFGTLTERKRMRPPLPVSDASLAGNPANREIQIGDPVIRESEFKEFVASISRHGSELP